MQSEIPVPIVYDGLVINVGYRIDLLVEQCVVVELKTVRALMSVHHAQLLSYLRLSKMPTGLLIVTPVTPVTPVLKSSPQSGSRDVP